ncbi:MAG: hypothetical protein HOH14_02390 [Gammaproteobacteria bacterium]|jgi:hypothetical protein|nr:hypothetical protein [Gammaproteobacteria bacterium]MBT6042324.1 hypothetical protein [Gammaproteobacteria bacterium]
MKKLFAIILTSALCLFAVNGSAHHSLAVEFDSTTLVTVEGLVTEVWFKNPHVRYYLTVTNESGEEVEWDTHAHNITGMSRQGYTKDTLKVGDRVILEGHGTRDGSPKLFIRAWTLPDGIRRAVGNANIDRF